MDKPLSILLEDTRMNLINTLQESKLSPVLLLPIVEGLCREVATQARVQTEKERKAWEESQRESQEKPQDE